MKASRPRDGNVLSTTARLHRLFSRFYRKGSALQPLGDGKFAFPGIPETISLSFLQGPKKSNLRQFSTTHGLKYKRFSPLPQKIRPVHSTSKMTRLVSSFVALACLLASPAFAAIGPVADLVISNKDVTPDGFTRGAVVAGDSTIGPLIVGNKVCTLPPYSSPEEEC